MIVNKQKHPASNSQERIDLHILIFIEDLGCGGAQKSLINLLQLIDYSKISIDLATVVNNGEFERYATRKCNRISLPNRHGVYKLLAKLCQLYYSLRWRIQRKPRHKAETLWSCMSAAYAPMRKEYDVAIAYQQGLPTYYIATKVKAEKKISWVNTDLKSAGYREAFNRRYYDKFDHIVTVSDKAYGLLCESGYCEMEKVSTIYDTVHPDLIRRMAEEFEIESYFSKSSDIKIVTVGRLATPKNYPLAVMAASILRDRGIRFEWIFVGDGPERANIERLITELNLQDHIKLMGSQPNPYPFMKACDIYVQTSSFEGFGLTIAEAKILGKPIVSTNFDVVHDQLSDGINGLIADMTPESVAEKIELLILDKSLRHRIADAASKEQNKTNITEIAKFNRLLGL